MANLLSRLWRREPEISRSAIDDYLGWVRQAQLGAGMGYMGGFMNPAVTLTGKRPAERVENSFAGYINGAFKVNPIVFGVMAKRAAVLSEARFAWREKVAGKPGELYYDDALGVLERPWPNGTTGELLSRMIQDVDLAGNFYAVNEGDRLRRLRPDWVQIILTGNPLLDLDVDVLGYLYTAGGPDSGGDSKAYRTSEICHWTPQPDPDALYRGMSWVTPVIREIQGDQAAMEHKLSFFRNGATLGPIIKAPPGLTVSQFTEFVEAAEAAHRGVANAYKTMYLAGGSDVTLASANMQQIDFSSLQGKAETRICVAASIPASIAGVSEGLQGSSLNAGNYGAAKREWADTWLRPTWRSACAALSTIVSVPDDADLWYDECDITFLHEDRQDAANIAQTQMATVNTAITAGFKPETAVVTVNPAWKDTLEHTGMFSVQLQQPGQGMLPPGGAPAGSPAELPPVPPGFEPDTTVRALQTALDLVRATQSQSTGTNAGGGTLHEPAGSPKGGQFTANPSGGSGLGYQSILPAASAYNSGSGSRKPTAAAPTGTPQPPAEPRTMKPGDSGEDVRYAQYGMSLLGFNVAQSGTYDDATVAAVKQLQERLGVKKPNGHLTSAQLRQIQTAVRLSPCIGRSDKQTAEDWFDDIMRSADLEYDDETEDDDGEDVEDLEPYDSAPDPELDDESEPDEDTQALIAAISEVTEGVSRSFNEALHPRNPKGSVGGGRFRSIADRIVAALSDWKRGNGPDDPLKDFNRDQLLKAAKAHGHMFRRGAPIEEIKAQILDDVRNGTKAEKAAAPHLPGAPADHRRFTIQLRPEAAKQPFDVQDAAAMVARHGADDDAIKAELEHLTTDQIKQVARQLNVPGSGKDYRQQTYVGNRANVINHVADVMAGHHRRTTGDNSKSKYVPGSPLNVGGPGSKPSGTATDVGIFAAPSTGKLSLYRESDTGKKQGRAIKSFDDMGQLEAWARDNGHTELADYAKAEQARTGGAAKVAKAAPAKPALSRAGAQALAEEMHRDRAKYQTRQQVEARLAGLNVTELEMVATAFNIGAPVEQHRGPSGGLVSTPKTLTADEWRQLIAQRYVRDYVESTTPPPSPSEIAKGGATPAYFQHLTIADVEAGLEGLTTVQKRAALRKRGLSKAEIDALVSLKEPKAPRGPRPSGLPHDRTPLSADFTDLSERIAGKPEAQILETLQDLNASELTKLARKFPGNAMIVPGVLKQSDRRQGLKIPDGLTLDEKRRWLAKQLATQRFHWRSQMPDDEDEFIERAEVDEEDVDPDLAEIEAWAEEDPDDFDDDAEEAQRALGHDVTPGHDELHHYWTRGPGLAKWAESPKPWTTLVAHLTKYVGPLKAKIYASRWFIEVFHYAAGSDKNRVAHGHPPRGHRIGPG